MLISYCQNCSVYPTILKLSGKNGMTSFFYLSPVFCIRLQAKFQCTSCTFVMRPRVKRQWLLRGCSSHGTDQSTRPSPSTEAHLRPLFTLHPISHSKSYGQVQCQWGMELDSPCRERKVKVKLLSRVRLCNRRKRDVNVCGMIVQTTGLPRWC